MGSIYFEVELLMWIMYQYTVDENFTTENLDEGFPIGYTMSKLTIQILPG